MTEGTSLRRWQVFALQVFIPIALIGLVLPIGLPAFVLQLDNAPFEDAIKHGELFLAGGNMAFTSCLVALSLRPDRAMTVSILNSVVYIGVVMPCYFGWVHIATASVRDTHSKSAEAAILWGLMGLAAGVIVTVVLVAYAFVPTRPTEAALAGESATLRG